MSAINAMIGAAAVLPKPITAEQKKALSNLHQAATQLEGVFLQMVMSSMRETVPENTIFGNDSGATKMWQSMLDDEYSQQMATSGSFGLAKQLESQMRSAVLGNAHTESNAHVDAHKVEL
jgi:Rod binding domain-containing protein